jgi:hypothetical protein
MEAKLYLERINQEMINKKDTAEIIREIDKGLAKKKGPASDWGGNVWDKSCCIINIGKRDPRIRELEEIGHFIMMRRERFGGLVWVRKTNAVYQVDEQAFMVLNDLDNGVTLKQAAKSANVTERSIKSLVAKLQKPVSARRSRV